MATNNAINLKLSGIVAYSDVFGVFNGLTIPLPVINAGTGLSSFPNPYGIICGGTTVSGSLQNISPGSANEILTSNGAGVLPSFQVVPDRGTFITIQTLAGSPADATTYYLGQAQAITSRTASGASNTRIYLCKSYEIDAVYGAVIVGGTLASAGSSTINIRKNNTTNYLVTNSLAMSSATNTFNVTANLGSFVAGDYIDVTLLTPTWTTNPTTVSISVTILLV